MAFLLRCCGPLALIGLMLAVGPGAAVAGPAPSKPHDPDLNLGKTCGGHPDADALIAALPTYVKELVVMWPRAGKRKVDGTCTSVARLTIVNHQGVLLTLSVVLHQADAPEPRDYRVLLDDDLPRAVLEVRPESERSDLLVEIAGAPSTSREALEGTLEFVPIDEIVTRLSE